ncbi:MAG: flagellin [Clostridia bacterium]|nr:flagellin [Clostridia bacterium]
MAMKIDAVAKAIVNPQPTGTKPAELSISESMKAQENALDQGSENLQDAISLGQTAEGALNSVVDNLQQIRELTIQSQNGTYTDSDREIIQDQVNQLLTGIDESLRNTEFNTIKLFDGGFDGNIQGGGEGQGRTMTITQTSLDSLGLNEFDITNPESLDALDKALTKVNDTRGEIGSQTNAFESAIRSNEVARENTLSARTQFDEDLATQITELKRLQITQQYQFQLQNKESETEKGKLDLLS